MLAAAQPALQVEDALRRGPRWRSRTWRSLLRLVVAVVLLLTPGAVGPR